ncbi:hypothetical protein ACI2K4_23860 [Micromonospora sp. NPDC050397]|uniref:hypothetical protein n=1 Tax=Micromonospora sp. NPDC050397 TaxID=3364279 RepID=UPI00384A74FD
MKTRLTGVLGRLLVALAFVLPCVAFGLLSSAALPGQDGEGELGGQKAEAIATAGWQVALTVAIGLLLGIAGAVIQFRLRRRLSDDIPPDGRQTGGDGEGGRAAAG